MYKLGITGGIGSGKSTATSFFNNKNTFIFDADKESKKHLMNSIALQHKICNAFGNDLKTKSGTLNLKELANRAFLNQKEQSILNGIMWPEIYLLIEKKINSVKNNYNLFIVDAALIFEANLQNLFDSTLLITANLDLRIERSAMRLNLPREKILERINLQLDEEKKKKLADYVIINDHSISKLNEELKKFFLYRNLLS